MTSPTQSPAQSGLPATAASMHDGVDETHDLCICEPEPRWAQVAEELEARDRTNVPARDQARSNTD